jgi:hypothetical protein
VVHVDKPLGTKCWILQPYFLNYQVYGPLLKVLVVGFDPPMWNLGTSSACLMHSFMKMSFLVQDQNCSMFAHGWYVFVIFCWDCGTSFSYVSRIDLDMFFMLSHL